MCEGGGWDASCVVGAPCVEGVPCMGACMCLEGFKKNS